jgi:hypothetical protein
MTPAPQFSPDAARRKPWSFLEQPGWTVEALEAAVQEFLANQPPPAAVVGGGDRLRAAKLLPEVGERQQVALAAAALALAGYRQELAVRPAAPGVAPVRILAWVMQAAGDAWQAVWVPEVYRLWTKEALRPRLVPLLRTAFERAEAVADPELRAEARTCALLRELGDAVEQHLPELAELATRLRARLTPWLEAAQAVQRQGKLFRQFDTLVDQIVQGNAGEGAAQAARIDQLATFVAAQPWILAERAERLTQAMDGLGSHFASPEPARSLAPLAEAAGRLAATVAERIAADGAQARPLSLPQSFVLEQSSSDMGGTPMPRGTGVPPVVLTDGASKQKAVLLLLHRATLLAWTTRRLRAAEPGRRDLARIASVAFDAATRAAAAPDATVPTLKAAGEIAAIRLRTVAGPERLAAGEAGSEWFRRACPGGWGDLTPGELPLQRACLQCLDTAHRRADVEKALRAWLLQPGCAPATARQYLLTLAERKLDQIEALGRDAAVSETNGLKSLLRKAAAQLAPAADPLVAPLTRADDAAIHLRLMRLHAVLGEWPEVARQAGFFLQAQPAVPGSWPRRRARAEAQTALARALVAPKRGPDGDGDGDGDGDAEGGGDGDGEAKAKADAASRAALEEYWTPEALTEQLRLLQANGATDAWAEALAAEPPRGGGAGEDFPPLLAHVAEALQQSPELRAALLARAGEWFHRHFLASVLRRALTPEHPFVAELRPALHDSPRGVSLATRLLAQQLVSWRYLNGGGAGDPAADFGAALARWAPTVGSERELAAQLQAALEVAAQATLGDFATRALAALAARDAEKLRRILRGGEWQPPTPAGYKHLDNFDLAVRLRRWWWDLKTDLHERNPRWVLADVEGASCWIRGAAWLDLRPELHGLLWPGAAALDALFGPTEAGGTLACRVQERELSLQLKLNTPLPPERRPLVAEALAAWIRSVPAARCPAAGWDANYSEWKLTLKIAGSANREATPLLREAERQLDRLLGGGQIDGAALLAPAAAWLRETPRPEQGAQAQRLLRWAHDFATMRVRLWLVEERTPELWLHPRLVLRRFLTAREIEGDVSAYPVLLQRFLRFQPGPVGLLDLTATVREAIAQRRAQAGLLRYRLELEPGCLVRVPAEVAGWVLHTLCASAEKQARAVASNAEIAVKLWTDNQLVRLEVAHPCAKKGDKAAAENGGSAEALAWVVQLHRGELTAVATQRNAQATLTLPLAHADAEPRATEGGF